MNKNKLYFIQTGDLKTGKRQCWLVSSPRQDFAEGILVWDDWISPTDVIISSEEVHNMVDTDEEKAGKTYIKMHN